MKMRSLTIFWTLLFISPNGLAETASKSVRIAFGDLPKLVREKNEKVQASETAASAAQSRTGFLTRSFLPGIALKAGSESAQFGSASSQQREFWGAEAKLNLYRGGRDKIEEKIRESKSNALKAESTRDFRSELREARKAYWQIIAAEKTIVELNDAIKSNNENIKSAKRRSGAGVTTTADAVQFELEGTLLNQQLKKMTLEKDLLLNSLAVAIAADSLDSLEVDGEFPHPPESVSTENDLTNAKNPEIEVLKSEELANSLKKDQSSRWWVPSLDVYSVYRRPSLLEDDARALARENEWATGIQLSFSLDQGLEDRVNANAQELEVKATSLRLAHSQREYKAVKHNLIQDLNLLHELIHDADRDIEKASAFLKLTKTEYNRGVKNGPDLLEAFAKFYEFRNRHTELHRNYFETQAELAYQASLDN